MKYRTLLKKLCVNSMGLFLTANVFAQSELPEFVANPAKTYKKVWYDFPKEGRSGKKGGGYSVSMDLLKEPPKKVALVSFFTFDPGCTKTYSYSTTREDFYKIYTTTHTITKELSTKGNAGNIAAGMYYSCIDEMVAKYKSYGMDLLLPEQYLDTQEKKDYYNKFEVGHGGLQHGFKKWLEGGSSANDIYGTVSDYNVLDVVDEPQANYEKKGMFKTIGYSSKVYDKQIYLNNSDDKFMNSMGYDLAKNLGVDAVVFVYATIYVPKESKVVLQNVRMVMMGQNPVQLGEKDKKPFFYHNGVFYAGASISPECEILNKNKKDPETEKISFAGFKELIVALSDKIGLYITKKED